jgi:hypothetical protein
VVELTDSNENGQSDLTERRGMQGAGVGEEKAATEAVTRRW